MAGKKLNKKGITLIELLTVVVLIGIIVALAVPNFDKAITKIRHKSTSRDMLRQMRLARSYAISKAGRYGVYANGTDGYYILFRNMADDNSYDRLAAFPNIPDSMMDSTDLKANISFGSCGFINCTAVFRGNGSALESGYVDVVNDNSSDTTRVNVTAAVGRVYLSTH